MLRHLWGWLFLFAFLGGFGVAVLDAELGLDGGGDGVLVDDDVHGLVAGEETKKLPPNSPLYLPQLFLTM